MMKRSFRKGCFVTTAVAVVFGLASCSSHKKHSPRRPAASSQVEAIHVKRPGKSQRSIVDAAYEWLGTPYKYGGSEKGVGTDCSGMVLVVYEQETGIKIPRNSAKQAEFCKPLEPEDVEIGDLVFFATGKDPDRISHVGIVIDDKRFIHASTSKGVVISDLYSPYYIRTFKMFGRIPK